MIESPKNITSRNGTPSSGDASRSTDTTTPTTGQPDGLQETAAVKANEVVDMVQDVIRRYPAVSLGVAVATGLTIGWLVKRR